jgi:hypothetical protein
MLGSEVIRRHMLRATTRTEPAPESEPDADGGQGSEHCNAVSQAEVRPRSASPSPICADIRAASEGGSEAEHGIDGGDGEGAGGADNGAGSQSSSSTRPNSPPLEFV